MVKKPSQENIWDSIASKWDEFRKEPYAPAVEFLKKESKNAGKFLDFGCGSGRNFLKIKDSRIYGVDFSEKMIHLARIKSRKEGFYVELRKIQDETIPFTDNFFDGAISVAVIHCIDAPLKRKKALSEIYRVLKSNSKAFISVWSKNHKRIKTYGEVNIPWKIEEKVHDRYYYIYKKQEFLDLLEEVGFKIESVKEDDNINVIVSKR